LEVRRYKSNPKKHYVFLKPSGGTLTELEEMPPEVDSWEKAREWLHENRDRIEDQIKEAKSYEFRLSDNTPRVGPDWRNGRDIDQNELKEECGLHELQF